MHFKVKKTSTEIGFIIAISKAFNVLSHLKKRLRVVSKKRREIYIGVSN